MSENEKDLAEIRQVVLHTAKEIESLKKNMDFQHEFIKLEVERIERLAKKARELEAKSKERWLKLMEPIVVFGSVLLIAALFSFLMSLLP